MDGPGHGEEEETLHTILAKTVYAGIDHHWKETVFASCGQQVDIWDEQRTNPTRSMTRRFNSIVLNLTQLRHFSWEVMLLTGI